MPSARRRLERLEASAAPTIPGRTGNLAPEQEAERTRQFRVLFRKLGMPRSPPIRDPGRVRDEMFGLIASCREANDRKE